MMPTHAGYARHRLPEIRRRTRTRPDRPPGWRSPCSAAGSSATATGRLDRDGLRVNEGGEGDLRDRRALSQWPKTTAPTASRSTSAATATSSSTCSSSRLARNGSFSAADFDDGFDIDELDGGDILGQIVLSSANDNFEQGFDFNENDGGDLRVNMLLVEANDNREEGIEYEEDDDFAGGGHIVATLLGIRANGNGANDGDAGLKLREKGDGDLMATLNGIETLQNLVSGVLLREDAAGSLFAEVTAATSRANADRGIDIDENGRVRRRWRRRWRQPHGGVRNRRARQRRLRHPRRRRRRRRRHLHPHQRHLRDQRRQRGADDHALRPCPRVSSRRPLRFAGAVVAYRLRPLMALVQLRCCARSSVG